MEKDSLESCLWSLMWKVYPVLNVDLEDKKQDFNKDGIAQGKIVKRDLPRKAISLSTWTSPIQKKI